MAVRPAVARRYRASLLVLAIVALSGCAEGLLFRNDHLITIESPRQYAAVSLPIDVRFAVREVPAGATYAVFLDRDPQPPGRGLDYFKDRSNIFTTTSTQLEIKYVEKQGGTSRDQQDSHEITVVVLGADGRRMTESAGYVQFEVAR